VIVQVTMWNSPYLGNFMASQLALARTVAERFGLPSHFVLGPGGAQHGWTADLDAAGVAWSELPADRRAARAHVDRVVREQGGRLVHAHFTGGDLPAAGAAAAARVPCVWHMHTGFLGYPARQRIKDLWKIGVVRRRARVHVIAVAPWLVALARRRGVPAKDITMIPNALVLERFAARPKRAAARARFGLPDDAQVAVAFGWWPDVKGVDVVVDALERAGGAWHGLLVGEEAMRAFLTQRFPDGVPAWLHTTGFVEDPALLYAAADVFVSASRHEGQPYSVGEAIACGLPVALSQIPGTRFYETAPDALPFPGEDAGALARCLATIAERDAPTRARLAGANAAWARERLAVDRWCDAVAGVYAELLRR
jgi:glycosyltransferase involved in cell wall biosynthesis